MSRMQIINPEDLLYLAMSFIEPRAVQIACQQKLFTHIAHGCQTSAELEQSTQCNARAIERILLVCASLGLVYKEAEKWQLTDLASEYLIEGQNSSLCPIFTMAARSYHSFDQLPAYATSGEPIAPPPHYQHQEVVRNFMQTSWAMGRVQAEYMMAQIKGKFSPTGNTLLDIGAGSGIYTTIFLKHFPQLRCYAVELPQVAQIVKQQFEENRVTWLGQDVIKDGLPNVAFDVALLASFIHGFSPQQTRQLLARIYEALPTGGVLLIQDHFLRPDPKNPGMAALFNLNIALHNAGGGVQTLQQIETQLREVGFREIEVFDPVSQPGLMPVLLSTK